MTVNVRAVAFAEAVGVPVIAPVAAFRVNPDGNTPLAKAQVYGEVPPDAEREAE